MDRKSKAIWITLIIVAAILIGVTAAKGIFLDNYFDNQPVTTIPASYFSAMSKIGGAVVVQGQIIPTQNGELLFIDTFGTARNDEFPSYVKLNTTDKINCYPNKKMYYNKKIVGTWSHDTITGRPIDFHLVWVIGGC